MPATLILTRPVTASRRFLAQVELALGHSVPHVIGPLMRIDPLPAQVPPQLAIPIFTSENGVAQAARLMFLPGSTAFCVGDRTAAAATQAGFQAVSANGNVEALLALLLDLRPKETLVHVRGKHATGSLVERLRAGGLVCSDVVAYDQVALPLPPLVRAALLGEMPVALPLFSPRSAELLAAGGRPTAPVHVLAISAETAEKAQDLATASLKISKSPSADQMLAGTCNLLRILF